MSAAQVKALDKYDPPRNGYELVTKVLAHSGGDGVAKLIQLANGQETEWLEFKGSKRRSEQGRKQSDAEGPFQIPRAVISMLNTHGGVVIVGLDENKETHELEATGWENCFENKFSNVNNRDKFTRDLLQELFRKEWKLGTIKYRLIQGNPIDEFRNSMSAYVENKFEQHEEKELLLLLIKPLDNQFPLLVSKRWTKPWDDSWQIKKNLSNLDKLQRNLYICFTKFQSLFRDHENINKLLSCRIMPDIEKFQEYLEGTKDNLKEIKKQYNIQQQHDHQELYLRRPGEAGETITRKTISEVIKDKSLWSRAVRGTQDRSDYYEIFWNRYKEIVKKENSPSRLRDTVITVKEKIINDVPMWAISVNRKHKRYNDIERIINDYVKKSSNLHGEWYLYKGAYNGLKEKLEEKFGKHCCTAQNEI